MPLALSTLAIRVPTDGNEQKVTESPAKVAPSETPLENKHDTFYVTEQTDIDTYLIPPEPQRHEEVLPEFIVTPATHFLPPSPEIQIDYYAPEEAGKQTDWYPIAPVPVQIMPGNLLPQAPLDVAPVVLAENQTYGIPHNLRSGKAYTGEHFALPVPSRELEPPLENAPNDYVVNAPSEVLEVPSAEIDEQYYIPAPVKLKIPIRKNPKKPVIKIKSLGEPSLALHLMPPKFGQQKFKKPTKIYPKKVTKGFRPILIPISQFAEDSLSEIPRAKPASPFKPISSDESEHFTPSDEKNLYLYNQIEQKRKSKGENEVKVSVMCIYFIIIWLYICFSVVRVHIICFQQQPAIAADDAYGIIVPAEQQTSETNYGHSGSMYLTYVENISVKPHEPRPVT